MQKKSSRLLANWQKVDLGEKIVLVAVAVGAMFLALASSKLPGLSSLELIAYDTRAAIFRRSSLEAMNVALVDIGLANPRNGFQNPELMATQLAIFLNKLTPCGPSELMIEMDDHEIELLLNYQPLVAALNRTQIRTLIAHGGEDHQHGPDYPAPDLVRSKAPRRIDNPQVKFVQTGFGVDADSVMRRWPPAGKKPHGLSFLSGGAAFANTHDDEFTHFNWEFDKQDGPRRIQLEDFLWSPPVSHLLPGKPQYGLSCTTFRGKTVLAALPSQESFVFRPTAFWYAYNWRLYKEQIYFQDALINSVIQIKEGSPPLQSSTVAYANYIAIIFGFLITFMAISAKPDVGITKVILAFVSVSIASIFALCFHAAFKGSLGIGQFGLAIALFTGAALARQINEIAQTKRGLGAALALHAYLPPSVAREVMESPESLNLEGANANIVALFTDLEGFTNLSHVTEPRRLAKFLNEYLDAICQAILDNGGTIDKFVGDAVVAFWGAPASSPDDATNAVRAALAIQSTTARFLGLNIGGTVQVGRTRIGLHYGQAIVGNFGGSGRLQYTALGDTMNVAARLEAANKVLGSTILISGELRERVPLIPCFSLGRLTVRGRETSLQVFEPCDDLPGEDFEWIDLRLAKAIEGDCYALDELRDWTIAHPQNATVSELVSRLWLKRTA